MLGFVTAEYLFARHPDLPEGDLTRIRAALVCEQSLHEVAQKLNLGSYLKLGKGEEAGGGRHRASILADATEAVFAAVYLDGGITAASELIHRVLLDVEREEVVEERRRDYKTLLQEHIQRKAGQELTYCMVREEGPDHAKTFVTEVRLNGARHRRGQRPQQEGIGADGRQICPGKAGQSISVTKTTTRSRSLRVVVFCMEFSSGQRPAAQYRSHQRHLLFSGLGSVIPGVKADLHEAVGVAEQEIPDGRVVLPDEPVGVQSAPGGGVHRRPALGNRKFESAGDTVIPCP